MRLQNPFAAIATSGLDSQILVTLARSEEHLTIPEIQKLLPEEGSREGVRKAVSRLVQQGTLTERSVGGRSSYALNRDHLLAEPILKIAGVKKELLRRLAELIESWPEQPHTVKLFGSAARSEMTNDSDIDLLIVMPEQINRSLTTQLTDRLVAHAKTWTGNDVRPLLYFADEVRNAPIFSEILKEGIDVAGDPLWLGRKMLMAH